MKIIMQMKACGQLTEQQVLAAWKFSRAPRDFEVAPTFYRVLHDAIIQEEPLGAMEKRRGWPARSAKAIIGLVLHALQEMGATHAAPSDSEDLREKISFLTAEDNMQELGDLMKSYGLTLFEARLLLILMRTPCRELSRDLLHSRLYHDRPNDAPEIKILDVMVCNMRAKLCDSPWNIETVRGIGFKLSERCQPVPDQRWLLWYGEHVHEGHPLIEVAKRHDVPASLILRAIQKLVGQLDDDTLEKLVREALDQRSKTDGHLATDNVKNENAKRLCRA